MAEKAKTPTASEAAKPLVIEVAKPRRTAKILFLLLVISVIVNFVLYASYQQYFATNVPSEHFHSGSASAENRIALIQLKGTIMGSVTRRTIGQIEQAADDDRVKGVVLNIDSPGGLVADSHQIYHALTKLREKKPIYVSMKRIAASGGLYAAMGAGPKGKIFVEPTTWTGSIGVIIPRYNVKKLAETHGVDYEPLTTGPLKNTLSPFRDLNDTERKVWDAILDDSFDRFLGVIADNRKGLDKDDVRKLATGQIYTAQQAIDNKLVDAVGFEEDVLDALLKETGLKEARVVTYEYPPDLTSILTGMIKAESDAQPLKPLLDTSVPRAMYYCGWGSPSIEE
jgi:protease-4